VKRPWAEQLRNNGSIPVWCKISLSFPKRLYRFWGLSPLYSPDMWNYFFPPRSKESVYEADKSILSNAEFKKCICFSTHHCLYCLLRDKFTLFLFVQDMMLECYQRVCVFFCILVDQLLLVTEWRTIYDVPKFAKDKYAEGHGTFVERFNIRLKVKLSN